MNSRPSIPTPQAGITAGGAQLAAAGSLIAQVIVQCGEPERGAGSRHTQRVKAPGALRPEGVGRKPYSQRPTRVAGIAPLLRRHRELASGSNPRLVAGRRIGAAWNVLRSHLATLPALNSVGAFKALRGLLPRPLVHDANQTASVVCIRLRPAFSFGFARALHEQKNTRGAGACPNQGGTNPYQNRARP